MSVQRAERNGNRLGVCKLLGVLAEYVFGIKCGLAMGSVSYSRGIE